MDADIQLWSMDVCFGYLSFLFPESSITIVSVVLVGLGSLRPECPGRLLVSSDPDVLYRGHIAYGVRRLIIS